MKGEHVILKENIFQRRSQ